MAWTFGDSTGSAIDEGLNYGLKRKQLAFERIKQKYEMATQAYQHAWTDVINNENMPNQTKALYYNKIIVPYNKTYLGVDTPVVQKWNTELNDAADKMAGLYDNYKSGQIKLPELQSAILHLKAEVASNPKAAEAFKPADEVLNAAMGRNMKELTVGGQKGTYQIDELGNVKPLMVGNQAATGRTSESITEEENQRKAFQDNQSKWLEAAKIVETAKETGIGADIRNMLAGTSFGQSIGLTKDSTDKDVQRAVNLAHGELYRLGGQIGMTTDQVTSVVTGKASGASIMNHIGQKFAIPGATPQLPGLTVTPKAQVPPPTVSMAPAQQSEDEPTLAQAPTAEPVTPPATTNLADNAEQPTDQQEQNA